MPEEEREKQGIGCLGKGCIVVAILCVAAMIVVYVKAGDWARSGSAYMMEWTAEATFDGLKLPESEKEAALEVIRAFGDKIRENRVSGEQGARIVQKLMDGPVPVVVATRAFEVAYLQPSDLGADAKRKAHRNVTRFARGVAEEKIPREKGDEIMKQAADEAGIPRREFKIDIAAEIEAAIDEGMEGETDASAQTTP